MKIISNFIRCISFFIRFGVISMHTKYWTALFRFVRKFSASHRWWLLCTFRMQAKMEKISGSKIVSVVRFQSWFIRCQINQTFPKHIFHLMLGYCNVHLLVCTHKPNTSSKSRSRSRSSCKSSSQGADSCGNWLKLTEHYWEWFRVIIFPLDRAIPLPPTTHHKHTTLRTGSARVYTWIGLDWIESKQISMPYFHIQSKELNEYNCINRFENDIQYNIILCSGVWDVKVFVQPTQTYTICAIHTDKVGDGDAINGHFPLQNVWIS